MPTRSCGDRHVRHHRLDCAQGHRAPRRDRPGDDRRHAPSRARPFVLTGEGSDEILAGYPKHAYDSYANAIPVARAGSVHDAVVEPVLRALPYGFRCIKTLAAGFGERDFTQRMIRWFGALSAADQARARRRILAGRHPYSKLHLSSGASTARIAVASPIRNCAAARRAGSPPSAASITRSRKSWL